MKVLLRRALWGGFLWALVVVVLIRAFGPDEPRGEARQAPAARPEVLDSDHERLRARGLLLPVEGMRARDLRDSFSEDRNGHRHEAVDILAPRGTRVLAVDDGWVERLFTSVRGGLSVYQFDPAGTYC